MRVDFSLLLLFYCLELRNAEENRLFSPTEYHSLASNIFFRFSATFFFVENDEILCCNHLSRSALQLYR